MYLCICHGVTTEDFIQKVVRSVEPPALDIGLTKNNQNNRTNWEKWCKGSCIGKSCGLCIPSILEILQKETLEKS